MGPLVQGNLAIRAATMTLLIIDRDRCGALRETTDATETANTRNRDASTPLEASNLFRVVIAIFRVDGIGHVGATALLRGGPGGGSGGERLGPGCLLRGALWRQGGELAVRWVDDPRRAMTLVIAHADPGAEDVVVGAFHVGAGAGVAAHVAPLSNWIRFPRF